MRFENLPRRSLLLGGAAASLVLAACSKPKPRPAPTSNSSTSSGTTAAPKPAVSGVGLPDDLLTVLTALYLGGTVPATGTLGAALAKRTPVAQPPRVSGTTGSWKGVGIASVSFGKDVTLLVKGPKGWQVVGGWWPALNVARPPMRVMRVLAIGSDARNPQPVTKCRGDAIHIIGVDPATGVGGIVGIPRDSWVPLAGGGSAKINAALVFGGVSGMVHSVSRVSGLAIDGYVITGFKGFRGMVSNLGGIVVSYPRALQSNDGYQILKAGTSRLDAKHALGFARERKHLPNGDFGRSANQGLLIKAGISMAQQAGVARLAGLLSKMGPWLQTDLSVEEVLNLSASLYLSPAATIPNKVVPGAVGTRDGQSVVLLGSGAKAVFADMRDGHLRA